MATNDGGILDQPIWGKARMSRRVKLWAVAALVATAALLSFYTWGDRNPLPYHVRDASVVGETLVGADNRTITLNTSWGGCDYEPDLVAHEAAGEVTLVLHRKDFSGPGVGCGDGGASRITTTLNSPLGTRGLVDGVTGKPIAYFDGRDLAKPRYLPSGYHEEKGPVRYMFGLASAPIGLPNWTRAFQSDSSGGGRPSLLISQVLGDFDPSNAKAQAHSTVQGHAAIFVDNIDGGQPAARTLSWFGGKYRFIVSASMPSSMTDRELIQVANGLADAG